MRHVTHIRFAFCEDKIIALAAAKKAKLLQALVDILNSQLSPGFVIQNDHCADF